MQSDSTAVAAKMAEIEQRLQLVENSALSINTAITGLGDDSFQLLRTIPISIRLNGEDFIASFFDANVSAAGETEQEAFDGLREVLIAKFALFESTPEELLGPQPARQFAVLKQFVRRK